MFQFTDIEKYKQSFEAEDLMVYQTANISINEHNRHVSSCLKHAFFSGATQLLNLRRAWDLGPFAAGLQSLHLDTALLQIQNTKKLHGTKNNFVCAVQANSAPKDQERNKQTNPTAISEEAGAKTGRREQKQGTAHAPCTQHRKGVGKPPKPRLRPDPCTHPCPHAM